MLHSLYGSRSSNETTELLVYALSSSREGGTSYARLNKIGGETAPPPPPISILAYHVIFTPHDINNAQIYKKQFKLLVLTPGLNYITLLVLSGSRE